MAFSGSPYSETLERVMPSIFVAGPAKSGSTFLWECLQTTFHPDRVCGRGVRRWGDEACGGGASSRFVLPALGGDVSDPSCLRFSKESSFWRYWGRRKRDTWQRYGGPRLPLDHWEQGSCRARRGGGGGGGRGGRGGGRFGGGAGGGGRGGGGPRALAAHRQMEDYCMADAQCEPTAYDAPLPARCQSTCTPCHHHPGWQDNYDAPCPLASYRCNSPVCADAVYVPKAVRRRLNYSGHHARAFMLTAFVSWSELAAANISRGRVASIEGNPGIFQTPPRHALALHALAAGAAGRARLRLIVGLRDPFDLAFSLWSFLSSIGQEGKRVETRMGRSLEALLGCNATLFEQPGLLPTLPPKAFEAYRACLDERKTSRQHFYVYGGLYALHLLGWLRLGYGGEQFLFVRMASLPRDAASARALQLELARFVGLPAPPDRRGGEGLCLQPTMTTRKAQRLRAHNASVRDVKTSFKASPTATRVHRFLDAHDGLLRQLLETHKVRVY